MVFLVPRRVLRNPGPPEVASLGPGELVPCYVRSMDGFVIDRADRRADGEDWTEDYEELPGRCQHLDHLGVDDDGRRGAKAAPTSLRRNLHHPTRVGDVHHRIRGTAKAMLGRCLWCPLTPLTSLRQGRTVIRAFTSTPTTASSRSGWSRDSQGRRRGRLSKNGDELIKGLSGASDQ